MKEKHLIESKSDKAFSRHRRITEVSDMLNPCAKRKKKPTIEEQFSDNDWKIVR